MKNHACGRIGAVVTPTTIAAATRLTTAGRGKEEQCSVCHEALSDPQEHIDCCTHSLRLPCLCTLRVRAETELRCPTYRVTATVDQSDRRVLQEHSDEMMLAALTTARRGMPEREERAALRARFIVGRNAARGSTLSAAYATEWWRTGPMYGWSVHVVCASSVRLGSWRTQLMAETDRPRSHSRAPPHTRHDNTLLMSGPDTQHFKRFEPDG